MGIIWIIICLTFVWLTESNFGINYIDDLVLLIFSTTLEGLGSLQYPLPPKKIIKS